MSRSDIEFLCGNMLSEDDAQRWELNTRAIACYPFDSRRAYIYFPWASKRACAIVVRGWYAVPS